MFDVTAKDQLISSALSIKLSRSFSSVAERLLPLIEREDVSPKEIAEIVKFDPGIATKIVSIANSAYYSRGSQIYSLSQAILNIGLSEVKNLIVCLVFLNNLLASSKLKKENLLFLWSHSLFVGCAARILCERLLVDEPEKVFTASLFHDIGKLVFFMNIDYYMETIEEAVKKRVPLYEIETERFGITHREIGFILANRLKFPELFGSVIRDHDTLLKKNGTSNTETVLGIINAADTFYYYRDIPDMPYGYILRKEEKNIESEVEKFTEIVSSDKNEK